MKKILLLISIITLLISNGFSQTTVNLSIDANGDNAAIDNFYPNTNFPDEINYVSGAWTINSVPVFYRSLLKFDLSSIPTNAIIQSAYLSLYYAPQNNINNGQHSSLTHSNESVLQRVTADWVKTTVTWNNQPPATAQNQVILPQSTSGTQDYLNMDVTTLIQAMALPASNYGFLLKLSNEAYYARLLLAAGDYPDAGKHPQLTVTYVLCGTLPPPTISAFGNTTFCNGSDVLLGVSSGNAISYQWKKNGAAITSATSRTYTAKVAGSFTCVVANACSTYTTNAITTTVLPLATESISANSTTFCAGSSVTLTGTNPGPGYLYQWYRGSVSINGANSLTYDSYSPGSIKLVITNTANNCSRISNSRSLAINCRLANPAIVSGTNYNGVSEVDSKLQLYPNPSAGSFTLELNEGYDLSGFAKIELINALGQIVYNDNVEVSNGKLLMELQLDNTIHGLYVFRMQIDNTVHESKVMIN